VLNDAARPEAVRIRLHRYPSASAGETAVREGETDVLIVAGRELVGKAEPEARLAGIVSVALQRVEVRRRVAALGLSPAQAATLLAPIAPRERRLEAERSDQAARDAIAFAGLILLLGVLLGYGASIAEGVAQEKGGRIMELLLCRVRARDLLAGKVLGIGLVGLAQMLLAVGAAFVAIVAVDAVDVPEAVPEMLVATVVWFVLGYAFWSVAFAAVGALVSRAEEVQSAYSPLSWLLVASYFAGVLASQAPDAWLTRLASWFPLTAPMVMPVRVAVGTVPAWEHAVSVAVMLACTYGLIRMAGAVYSGALLRSGARPGLREVWRAARAG
jgi:ABC-2 type transport system permease protein